MNDKLVLGLKITLACAICASIIGIIYFTIKWLSGA
jgi:hypothetical protein